MVNKHIKSVTAITEVFNDGQKIIAVAVEYDKDIDNSKLTRSTFLVEGRTITKIYTNNVAAKSAQSVNGKYVIIELSEKDKNASTIAQQTEENPQSNLVNSRELRGSLNPMRKKVKIFVKQIEDVITTDGERYIADFNEMVNNKEINMVVDDFLKLEFEDSKTGCILKYNLFIPKNYDKNKSYPMVVFIHDKGSCSTETEITLIQGLGGVIWASPAEQEKHECFVLAPEYSNPTVNDNFETTNDLDTTVELINFIKTQYNIDKDRLYITGQSMGCMSAIVLNIRHPDMFAASLLIAGQWEPKEMSALVHANMWIVVSEGDTKAFLGMNAAMDSLEAAGAKISRAIWNGQASEEELESNVNKMIAEGNNIKYTIFKNGTVVPIDQENSSLNNHMYTWRIAYTIEGLRNWLFTQIKS
jgi:predicted peptidase